MMILSRPCRDYNTQGKNSEGKRSKSREIGTCRSRWRAAGTAAAAAAFARWASCAGTSRGSYPAQSTPKPRASPSRRPRVRPQGAPGDTLPGLPTGLEAATFGAWLCLRQVSNNTHARAHTQMHKPKGFFLPFTICLCLFSQLLG